MKIAELLLKVKTEGYKICSAQISKGCTRYGERSKFYGRRCITCQKQIEKESYEKKRNIEKQKRAKETRDENKKKREKLINELFTLLIDED